MPCRTEMANTTSAPLPWTSNHTPPSVVPVPQSLTHTTSTNFPTSFSSPVLSPSTAPLHRSSHDIVPSIGPAGQPSSHTTSTTSLISTSSPALSPAIAPLHRSSQYTPSFEVQSGQSPPTSQPSHLNPNTHHLVPPTQLSPHNNHSPTPPIDGELAPGTNESRAPSKTPTESTSGKTILYLDGQGFLPSRPAANGVADILKSHYTDPWPSWKKIPYTVRDFWFDEFMRKFSICPLDGKWARKNFDMRGAALMKNNLEKAHVKMEKPNWIGESVWDRLCQHWGSATFKKKVDKQKQIGHLTVEDLECPFTLTISIGTAPTPAELFRLTHQRKDNTWVDRRSAHIDEEFTRTWQELTQRASEQGTHPPTEFDVWHDVAEVKKGRIYGLGLEPTVVDMRPY
ncbi:putative transposase, Ptta/En/Spm, plant [Sesbania bispinosa]|nr:putative transposase, Ptta/En/Spm, plant [Sesbania bispinosa]